MTPENKIRREILRSVQRHNPDEFDFGPLETDDQVTEAYSILRDSGANYDAEQDYRSGQVETDIPAPSSRNYSSRSVAAQTAEGEWVGWTYWYGGGKHANPECLEWMKDAYDLKCVEEEKLVVVRTFSRLDQGGKG